MSPCIILVRHLSRFIIKYMGKLRFTLTNVLFWIVLVLSCLLSENFAVFSANPMGGFSIDSAFILTISVIALLALYYFLEHKKNGLKFDKILLPALCIAGLLLVLNILRQGYRSFISYSNEWYFDISFSRWERIVASLQVVIWLSVIYALVFVYNRFRLNKMSYLWVAKLYLIVTLIMCVIDIFMEHETIAQILSGQGAGTELSFVMGNANVWSLLIFSGILSAILLSFRGYRWYYHAIMIVLFIFNLLTTCATTIFVSAFAIIAYTLFEIISRYKTSKKQSLKWLFIYLGICVAALALFAILIVARVPVFYNLWKFISNDIFAKNVNTLSGRTDIWHRVFILMRDNPLDIIFGLGHYTGSAIFQEYMGYTVKSAHNAFLEMFLRYGVIGFIVYVGIIGVVIYCFVRHIKEKNYRFAFIYGLCFICILLHSLTESTTLFTPNVGGLYFSFVFVLPVLNIIQRKHFDELKEDLLTIEVSKKTFNKKDLLISSIYVAVSVVITVVLKLVFKLGIYRTIFALVIMLVGGVLMMVLLRKDNPFEVLSNNLLLMYKNQVSKEKKNE